MRIAQLCQNSVSMCTWADGLTIEKETESTKNPQCPPFWTSFLGHICRPQISTSAPSKSDSNHFQDSGRRQYCKRLDRDYSSADCPILIRFHRQSVDPFVLHIHVNLQTFCSLSKHFKNWIWINIHFARFCSELSRKCSGQMQRRLLPQADHHDCIA